MAYYWLPYANLQIYKRSLVDIPPRMIESGNALLSRLFAVPSAFMSLTSLFEMVKGGTSQL